MFSRGAARVAADDGNQRIGAKAMTEHGGGEQQPSFVRGQRVDPCRDQAVERVRHLDLADVAQSSRRSVPLVADHAGNLDRVEGHAAGMLEDRLDELAPEIRRPLGEELAHGVVGQAFEVDAREAAHAGAPRWSVVEQLGTGEREDEDGVGPRPCRHVLDEVEQARIGPLEVLEDEDDRRSLGDPLEESPPGGEQLVALERGLLGSRQQGGEAWLDPAALGLVADELLERRTELPAGELGRRAVRDPGPAANHLRHRGERDSLSVGEGAAVVPRDLVGMLVDPTVELPRQPALADARNARHRHQAAASVPHDAAGQVGQLHELSIATDQRPGVRAARPTGGAVCGAGRSESLEPARPSPERERSDASERCRCRRAVAGGPVDQNAADGRAALQAGSHVDEVAGDHALARGADRDRGLTGRHGGARRAGPDRPRLHPSGRPHRRSPAPRAQPARHHPRGRAARPRWPSPRRR